MSDRITRKRVDWAKYADVSVDGGDDPPDDDALLRCETDRATYSLHPGNHTTTTELPDGVVDAADAIVVEDAFHDYESVSLDGIVQREQWRALLDRALSSTRPSIFLLDLPAVVDSHSEWASRSWRRLVTLLCGTLLLVPAAWVVHPALALLVAPFAVPSALLLTEEAADRLSLGGLRDRPSRLRGLAMLPWCATIYGGRSALVAHKLERFVAPKLGENRGRRPSILIDYGSLHLDLYYYLRYPRLRRFVLAIHERRGWGGKDPTYVDRVCEYAFEDVDAMYRNRTDHHELAYKQVVYELQRSDAA